MSTIPNLFDLSGRVAVVTGGSRGLGKAMVLGLARAGADVVIASRKLDACQAVAHEVAESTGRRAVAIACHVGKWDELDGFVDNVYAQMGRVDILVNNAGMSPLYGSPANLTEALFDKVLDVNLKGPVRLSILIGNRMASGDGGSIINISSMGSFRARPHIIPYAASKAGLNAVTVALARAFGPKVRVNCIVPGPFLTDVSKSWDMEKKQLQVDNTALGRIGRPEEIVGAVLYFASAASSYTTGVPLRIHGGEE